MSPSGPNQAANQQLSGLRWGGGQLPANEKPGSGRPSARWGGAWDRLTDRYSLTLSVLAVLFRPDPLRPEQEGRCGLLSYRTSSPPAGLQLQLFILHVQINT